jgi:hypothetical protein
LYCAKTGSVRPGQRQSTRKEGAKTGNSRECNQGLAQLRTDAKSREFRRLGSFARSVFVSKKTLGQISRLWGKRHFLSVAAQNARETWT